MEREVIEYSKYMNQQRHEKKKKKNWIRTLILCFSLTRKKLLFKYASKWKKELMSDAYTVLCQKTENSLNIF